MSLGKGARGFFVFSFFRKVAPAPLQTLFPNPIQVVVAYVYLILLAELLETVNRPRQGRSRPRSRPKRLIGDKAYDSDKLRERLRGKREGGCEPRSPELYTDH
jgi:hypothetical protein